MNLKKFILTSFLLASCTTTNTQIVEVTQVPSTPTSSSTPTVQVIPTGTPSQTPIPKVISPPPAIYPQLPGNGVMVSENDIADKKYKEVAFLAEVISNYKPETLPTSAEDKAWFVDYLFDQISNSDYRDLLNRKYKDKYDLVFYTTNYLERSLYKLNESTKKNELIQCMGWYATVSDLILLGDTAGIHHYPIYYPQEILHIKNKGDIYIFKPKSISEIQKNDTFIYNRHVGIVLNKYLLNGVLFFLVTEANSPKGATEVNKPNGTPYIYLVDEIKFIAAVGISDIYIARQTSQQNQVTPAEAPGEDIVKVINDMTK